MELSIPCKFILLQLHPERGRIMSDHVRFMFSLAGAVVFEMLLRGEMTVSDRKIVAKVTRNGIDWHDIVAEKCEKNNRDRNITFWIRWLGHNYRKVFRSCIGQLEDQGMVRHEVKHFLGFIPFNRYIPSEPGARSNLIRELRTSLYSASRPEKEILILNGLLKVSKRLRILAADRHERSEIRHRAGDLLKREVDESEITLIINKINQAIIATIATNTAAYS